MPILAINGRQYTVEAPNDTPLLWIIREELQLTGTKFGCGAGLCGACQERNTASWTACVAHVGVADDGTVKVKKLTVATDVGTAVNPDGIRAQVMGGAQWGMSLAMLEKATMKEGAIEQDNYDSYTPARMADMPEIDVAIIANGEPARGVKAAMKKAT